jgi:hypothetical protein
MTYARGQSDRLVTQPASGWTAHLGGLCENQTVVPGTNTLMYDDGLEWDGGTPSYVEAAYVATRVLKTLPSVEAQHAYVKSIQAAFVRRIEHLLSDDVRTKLIHRSESNTMAIPVSKVVEDLPFGMDYKIVNGTTYLRIGFGIHNLDYHLDGLVQVLEATGALE